MRTRTIVLCEIFVQNSILFPRYQLRLPAAQRITQRVCMCALHQEDQDYEPCFDSAEEKAAAERFVAFLLCPNPALPFASSKLSATMCA